MKLKNKKTGEIAEPFGIICVNGRTFVQFVDEKGSFKYEARSLAELNEEWEDAPEEPKEYWCIRENGVVGKRPYPIGIECVEQENRDEMREIGNYFNTEEEAEQAVEKLKAFKRLKDKGFKFEGWDNTDHSTIHNFSLFVAIEDLENINKDLDLLFGGEE